MLLYSWKKVNKQANYCSTTIVQIVGKLLFRGYIPKSKYDPLFYLSMHDYSGNDFLIYPERLFAEAYQYTAKEVAIYIAAAAARNLGDFLTSGTRTLDIELCPISTNAINDNRLLHLENDKVHFLFEEDTGANENGTRI